MGDEEQTPEPVAQPSTVASKKYYDSKFLESLKQHTATPALDAKAKAQAAAIENYADWDFAKDAVDAVTAEITYKMAQNIDALAAIMFPNPPAIKPIKKVIHRQTRLFEDERPRENWGYQIELRIRYAATERESGVQTLRWTEWDVIRLDHQKAFHRSRVRALKVLAQKLKRIPAYANPEYFQWRVQPFYMSRTWRERIQQKVSIRARGMAVKKAAREQQLRNELEMLHAEKEAKAGRANIIHKVNGGLTNGYEIVPSHTGSPADVDYVPVDPFAPLGPWEEKQTAMKLKEYAMADAVATKALYAVPSPLTIHPKAYADLLKEDKILG